MIEKVETGRVLAGYAIYEERSDSMVECLTRYQMVAGSSLSETTELCLWARNFILCIVLVQPRKTRPYLSEKMLTNQD